MTSSIFTVRASSWAGLFDCAYRWEWTHIYGHTKPAGMRTLLGTALHASTAVFDQGRVDGKRVTVDDAADNLVDTLRHPEFDVDRSLDDLTDRDAERIGLTLHTQYCLDVSPRYEFRAVEMLTAPMDIDCGNETIVRLTGRMDRARIKSSSRGVGIADLKSGGAAVEKGAAKTKGHLAQIATYELLYEHTTGEPITDDAEIIGLKTRGKPEIATASIHDAKRVMAGTEDQPGLIEHAAHMFRTGLFPPNPSSMLCSPKYCARWESCIFHE